MMMAKKAVLSKLGLIVSLQLMVAAVAGASPLISDVVHACVLVEEGKEALAHQQTAAAIDSLKHAAGLWPEWVASHQWLALAYQMSGEKESALAAYRRVQYQSMAAATHDRSNPADALKTVLDCEAIAAFLVNESRLEAGLVCLLPEPMLSDVARQHSLEMRDLGYFSHDSPTSGREDSMARFQAQYGLRAQWIAENVARRWGTGSGYLLTPQKITETHRDFLKKPGHRRNILLPQVERLGVGIAVDRNGAYWLTELMAVYKDD